MGGSSRSRHATSTPSTGRGEGLLVKRRGRGCRGGGPLLVWGARGGRVQKNQPCSHHQPCRGQNPRLRVLQLDFHGKHRVLLGRFEFFLLQLLWWARRGGRVHQWWAHHPNPTRILVFYASFSSAIATALLKCSVHPSVDVFPCLGSHSSVLPLTLTVFKRRH